MNSPERIRIENSLDALKGFCAKKALYLSDFAAMAIEAETLLSAINTLYDQFAEVELRRGIIGKKRRFPLNLKTQD